MEGKSLRKGGPIGVSGGNDPGVKQEDSALFNTQAQCHPDDEMPNNEQKVHHGSGGTKTTGLTGSGGAR